MSENIYCHPLYQEYMNYIAQRGYMPIDEFSRMYHAFLEWESSRSDNVAYVAKERNLWTSHL